MLLYLPGRDWKWNKGHDGWESYQDTVLLISSVTFPRQPGTAPRECLALLLRLSKKNPTDNEKDRSLEVNRCSAAPCDDTRNSPLLWNVYLLPRSEKADLDRSGEKVFINNPQLPMWMG